MKPAPTVKQTLTFCLRTLVGWMKFGLGHPSVPHKCACKVCKSTRAFKFRYLDSAKDEYVEEEKEEKKKKKKKLIKDAGIKESHTVYPRMNPILLTCNEY